MPIVRAGEFHWWIGLIKSPGAAGHPADPDDGEKARTILKIRLAARAGPRHSYFVVWRNNKFMREFMAITKALSDPGRVRILLSLRRGELCVCQITELFGLATSTVSKHLSILNQAGLILSRKTERWVYYRLPDKTAPVAVREALDWVQKSLAKTDEAAADADRLKTILKIDPVELCRRRCC